MKNSLFQKKYIPNYISVFRIILIPLYVLTFFGMFADRFSVGAYFISGAIFLLAGFSDAVDGFLARRFQWVSDIGKLLDPLADKLLEVAVAICLAVEFQGYFVPLATIIIFKEIIMVVGAFLILSKSHEYVSAVWCGKVATIVWYLLICVVHFFPEVAKDNLFLVNTLCIILILVMIMAFVIYVFNYATQIQSAKDAIIQNRKGTKRSSYDKD